MKRALSAALLLAVACACLLGALWRRSQAETREADRLRAECCAKATAALQARNRALAALAAIEAQSRACSGRVEEVERLTVESERKNCEALLDAARADGRLDVPPSDLIAVVAALRGRR
jgi:hypothetical protein